MNGYKRYCSDRLCGRYAGILIWLVFAIALFFGTTSPTTGAGSGTVHLYTEASRWWLVDTSSTLLTSSVDSLIGRFSIDGLYEDGAYIDSTYDEHLAGVNLFRIMFRLSPWGSSGDSVLVDSLWWNYFDQDSIGPGNPPNGSNIIIRTGAASTYWYPEYQWTPIADSTEWHIMPLQLPMGHGWTDIWGSAALEDTCLIELRLYRGRAGN